jgi:regulatory protein
MPVILKVVPRRGGAWVELVPDAGDSLRLPAGHVPSWAAPGARVAQAAWTALALASRRHLLLDAAARILARREHFEAELRRKLARTEHDAALIEAALAECRRLGYVDDARAAQGYAAELGNRGGMGSPRIRAELMRRGCPAELAASAAAAYVGLIDEAAEVRVLLSRRERQFAAKLEALRRRLARKQPDARRREYALKRQLGAAVGNYLAAQGFASEEARDAALRFVERLLEEHGAA